MKLRIPDFRSHLGLCASLLVVALSGGVARAQKIAIIDMQQAVLATSDGKKAAAAIDAKFAPLKTQLDQLQKEIVAKQDEYSRTRSTLSATAATWPHRRRSRGSPPSLTRKQEECAKQDYQDDESKQFGPIMPKLEQIINSYAAANQISFVVDTSANPNNLIYADKSLNIIAPVVMAYEKASGPPAPAAPASAAPRPPAANTTHPPAAGPKTTAPAK